MTALALVRTVQVKPSIFLPLQIFKSLVYFFQQYCDYIDNCNHFHHHIHMRVLSRLISPRFLEPYTRESVLKKPPRLPERNTDVKTSCRATWGDAWRVFPRGPSPSARPGPGGRWRRYRGNLGSSAIEDYASGRGGWCQWAPPGVPPAAHPAYLDVYTSAAPVNLCKHHQVICAWGGGYSPGGNLRSERWTSSSTWL